MHVKLNSHGVTLIELIVAIALLSVVMSSAYALLSFSRSALAETEAQFGAGQDARMAIMQMDKEIRKARDTSIGDIYYKAVDIASSGMQLNVYVDTDDDGILQLVQYKLDGENLVRGEASLGSTPTIWYTIVGTLKNGKNTPQTPIFSIDKSKIMITLEVLDENERIYNNPMVVKTSITVRSKGAMD